MGGGVERRLLLVNPAHTVAGRRHASATHFPVPPLNLGYVAALTPPGWEIRILDENLRTEDATLWSPHLVGITTLTPTAPRAYELAARFRARGATVVLGGMHASVVPEEAAEYADCVVIGDAETTWPKVVADYLAGRLNRIYHGEFRPLDGLVTPRRDLYPRGYWAESIITSRGCTHACEFCSVSRFSGRRYYTRPIDEVIDELEQLPRHRPILFTDDNFTLDRQRAIALCRRMVERGVRRRYFVEGGLAMGSDPELLAWLKRSGCTLVIVGIESVTRSAVAALGKPDLIRAGVNGYMGRIARIHAHGLAVFGSFIVGFDGDTPETFDQLRDFILAAAVDCALINILHPDPGTPLWDRLNRDGRLLYREFPGDYVFYSPDNVCFRPSGMTPLELQEGTRRLVAALTRLPVIVRRAVGAWRRTRDWLSTGAAFAWNWRTRRSLRTFPLRDVREIEAT
jgi:radical SAM superfamily enzyme YgiQ (UPF0313 family)